MYFPFPAPILQDGRCNQPFLRLSPPGFLRWYQSSEVSHRFKDVCVCSSVHGSYLPQRCLLRSGTLWPLPGRVWGRGALAQLYTS